jgi:hypothetical protein
MADISLSDLGKTHNAEVRKAELPSFNPLLTNPLELLGLLARRTTGDLFFPIERMEKNRARQ